MLNGKYTTAMLSLAAFCQGVHVPEEVGTGVSCPEQWFREPRQGSVSKPLCMAGVLRSCTCSDLLG